MSTQRRNGRIVAPLAAMIVGVAALVYLTLVVSNQIPKDNRLGTVELGIIVVASIVAAILLNPGVLERLTLKLTPGGLEMTLKEVERKQEELRSELKDVRFMLTYLLTVAEHAHLQALALGKADDYELKLVLRDELRKLRRLGLIEELTARDLDQVRDGEKVDLAKYFKLTTRGREYLRGLAEAAE